MSAYRPGAMSFDRQCKAIGLPVPVAEHRFHASRRWRFDFAWPDDRLAVEVEGGAFVAGRHTRGSGFEKDIEKYAEATALGWRVLRVLPKHITNGQALTWVERALVKA